MTAPAAMRQADVRRKARGLMQAARDMGMPPTAYRLEVVDDTVRLLPIAANAPSDDAADMERRMREAFGE